MAEKLYRAVPLCTGIWCSEVCTGAAGTKQAVLKRPVEPVPKQALSSRLELASSPARARVQKTQKDTLLGVFETANVWRPLPNGAHAECLFVPELEIDS